MSQILYSQRMLSVIIPTLNAESRLVVTLRALIPGVISGLIKEVIIVDGGSADATARIADEAGCIFVRSECGRGVQLARGATEARGDWLLFLHADTELSPGWEVEVANFMASPNSHQMAGVFEFALDDFGRDARRLERAVSWRCRLFGLPYGDQGLLIHRHLYDQLGGYGAMPLMEDVDLVRRIGRRKIAFLRSKAITSAQRYRDNGYRVRSLRNLLCLSLYFLRVPTHVIARLYG